MNQPSSSQFLDSALALAKKGFRVFPCCPGTKVPAFEGWQDKATSDPIELCELWADNPNHNPAVFTRGYVVIDADTYKGASLEKLRALGPIPDTFTVETARGGVHYYFKSDENFSNSPGALPEHFDVRGHGGLVLGPGAVFEGREYKVRKDVAPAPPPAWLASTLRRASARIAEPGTVIGELDTPDQVALAEKRICKAAPAIEGQGGDNHTIRVCISVFDFSISREKAFELLQPWNERCEPPWDDEDLRRKIESAWNSRHDPVGRDNSKAGLAPIEHPPSASKRTGLIFPSDISLEAIRLRRESALVEDLCHRGELGVIYADSTAGKSFLALDMSFAIALGLTWHGRKVARGPVLYVCLEGAGGFQQRILACSREHGDPGRRFAMLPLSASLKRGREGTGGLNEILAYTRELEAAAGEPVSAIIIDTLQRAMGGDNENDTSDMSHFVGRLGEIQSTTGAAVIVCHHCNASGNIRGSTALFASADFVLRIDRDKRRRKVQAEKVKEGRDGHLFAFELADVDIGADGTGRHYKSAVISRVAAADTVTSKNAAKPESKQQSVFREAARECLEVNSEYSSGGVARIPASEVESAFRNLYPTAQSDPARTKQTLDRYWRGLTQKPPLDFDVQKIDGRDYFFWIGNTDFNAASGSRIPRISTDKSAESARSHRERIADSDGCPPYKGAPNPIRPRPNTSASEILVQDF